MKARVTVTAPGAQQAVFAGTRRVPMLIADCIRAGGGTSSDVKALVFEMSDGGVVRYEPLTEAIIEGTVLESRIHA